MLTPANCPEGALKGAHDFFQAGRTSDADFIRAQLGSLLKAVERHEGRISEALHEDLGRSAFESYTTEILPVKLEIRHFLRRLRRWRSSRRVSTPWWMWPAACWVQPEPFGAVLILSPWNFPFQLSLMPLIAAIAAGNTVVIKPSEVAPRSADALRDLIADALEPGLVTVVVGDAKVAADLSQQAFDFVFFTGGEAVARKVAEAAGRNLAPCILELGGKNPCIVLPDASLEMTAKRIVWGKLLNAGQICLAPDHVWVEESIEKPLIAAIGRIIRDLYGDDPSRSADYGRIVNEKQLHRLIAYLEGGTVAHGGRYDLKDRYLEPTILTDLVPDAAISREEVFGPILPVYPFRSLDSLLRSLKERPIPLAAYVHTKNSAVADRVIRETRSGSVCVNDHVVQATVSGLPFGGAGQSGMGRYHGRWGFESFSQMRSVMRQSWFLDNPLRYPPGAGRIPLIKRLIG